MCEGTLRILSNAPRADIEIESLYGELGSSALSTQGGLHVVGLWLILW